MSSNFRAEVNKLEKYTENILKQNNFNGNLLCFLAKVFWYIYNCLFLSTKYNLKKDRSFFGVKNYCSCFNQMQLRIK